MKKRFLVLTSILISTLFLSNAQASDKFRILAQGSDLSGPNADNPCRAGTTMRLSTQTTI